MNGFLLDTNVISMLAPTKGAADTEFLQWLEQEDAKERIFLSIVTVHEIAKGIAILRHKGATTKAAQLTTWLDGLISGYDDKILPIDLVVAPVSGELEAKSASNGFNPGMADALIAGTAAQHGLVVVTHNTKHFESFGVQVIAPVDCAQI